MCGPLGDNLLLSFAVYWTSLSYLSVTSVSLGCGLVMIGVEKHSFREENGTQSTSACLPVVQSG